MTNTELIDELLSRIKPLADADRSDLAQVLPYLVNPDPEESVAARKCVIEILDSGLDLEFADTIGRDRKLAKANARFNRRYIETQRKLAESEKADREGPA